MKQTTNSDELFSKEFNKIGKQMPYRVPDSFFEQNHRVWGQSVGITRERNWRLPLWVGSSVAAAILVGFAMWTALHSEPVPTSEQLYVYNDTMSDDELESWVEFYEADLFVSYNEQE